jgi:hypothetical protein
VNALNPTTGLNVTRNPNAEATPTAKAIGGPARIEIISGTCEANVAEKPKNGKFN